MLCELCTRTVDETMWPSENRPDLSILHLAFRFPTMPRHSLPKAHELIVSFCKEHDLKYHEDDLFHGTMDIIKHLDQIAKEFVTEFPAM